MKNSLTPVPGGRNRHWMTGLILITVGALFLLDRLGLLEPGALRRYWPAVIALVGLGQLFTARQAEQRAWGGFLVFLALWLYASIEHLWDLSFRTSWPLILIAVGVTHIVCGLTGTRDQARQEAQS